MEIFVNLVVVVVSGIMNLSQAILNNSYVNFFNRSTFLKSNVKVIFIE